MVINITACIYLITITVARCIYLITITISGCIYTMTIISPVSFNLMTTTITGCIYSRLSAVEADVCQVSRPLRGLHDFTPTACVRNMRRGEGAWHVDLGVGEERRPRTAWRGPGRSMTAC